MEVNQGAAATIAIASAWEVWSEALFEVRRLVRANEWAGDMPDARQRADMIAQHNAQVFEAYARGRVQCAIGAACGDGDQTDTYDEHWAETWGEETTKRSRAAFDERWHAVIERQQQRRIAATQQREALESARVICDLG